MAFGHTDWQNRCYLIVDQHEANVYDRVVEGRRVY